MRRQLVVLFACLALRAQGLAASAATLLSVDFNDRTAGTGGGASNTQAGFSGWKMSGTTATSSAARVADSRRLQRDATGI